MIKPYGDGWLCDGLCEMLLLLLCNLLVLTVEPSSRVWRVRARLDLHTEKERPKQLHTQVNPGHRFHTSFAPHHVSPAIHVSEGCDGGRKGVSAHKSTNRRGSCELCKQVMLPEGVPVQHGGLQFPIPTCNIVTGSNMLHTAVWFGGSNMSCKCHKARTRALQSEKGLSLMVKVDSETYAPPPSFRTDGPYEKE